jgi:hypothetical protein
MLSTCTFSLLLFPLSLSVFEMDIGESVKSEQIGDSAHIEEQPSRTPLTVEELEAILHTGHLGDSVLLSVLQVRKELTLIRLALECLVDRLSPPNVNTNDYLHPQP